jgi:hypothetical protein
VKRIVALALAGFVTIAWTARGEPVSGPELDYLLQCRGCHGATGEGTAGRVPTLVEEPARLLRAPGGRAYLVRVPGVAQAPLDDAALAALLNWMLAAFSPATLPPDFAPYQPAEVARLRATPLADATATRSTLTPYLDQGPNSVN